MTEKKPASHNQAFVAHAVNTMLAKDAIKKLVNHLDNRDKMIRVLTTKLKAFLPTE